MTVVDERPPTEEDLRRDAKARLIARYAWRRGLTWPDIRALPWSSRSRKDLTVLRLVHEAYEESGDPEDRKRNPPSSIGSRTWAYVDFKLLTAGLDYEQGRPWVPGRDRLDDRDRWLAAAGVTTREAAPVPEPRPAVDTRPRGWAELAALPPLGYGSCIHHPDRRPVIITIDGGRCGDCPPSRDERFWIHGGTVVRDGWGMRLDWTPTENRYCLPTRCFCGRCPARKYT